MGGGKATVVVGVEGRLLAGAVAVVVVVVALLVSIVDLFLFFGAGAIL
jgi:hypothetical protein